MNDNAIILQNETDVLYSLILGANYPPKLTPELFKTFDYRTLLEKYLLQPDRSISGWIALAKDHPETKPLINDIVAHGRILNGKLESFIDAMQTGNFPKEEIRIDTAQFAELTGEKIKDILSLTIKHDEENKLIAFLGMLSAYTEDSQVNIMFNAPSSTGKSFIPTEVAKLFPKEDVLQYGGASPTAFFHSGKFDKDKETYTVDLERKILIFLDQPHDQLLQRLRSLLSHDEKVIVHKITDKTQRNGTKTKTILLKGFSSVVFCTASLKTDEQEATRCFLLSPESTQEKIKESVQQKLKRESDPEKFNQWLESNPDRRMLKERIRAIRDEYIRDIRISKPHEELILKAFLYGDKMLKPRDQRDIGRIVALIKVFALLNLWFRDRNGSTIIVNESDIDEAFKLWLKISESQQLNLAPYLYRLYQEIILPAFNEKNQGELGLGIKQGLTRKEILQKHLKEYGRPLPIDKLRFEILPQLEASGLIYQEADENDKRNKLIYPTNN